MEQGEEVRIFFIVPFLLLCACTHFRPADPNQNECLPIAGKVDPSDIERPSGTGIVKVLEYTDDGEFTDRCAFTDTMKEVWSANEVPNPSPAIIVTYIHGWKHNGDPGDSDLLSFTNFIKEMDSQESRQPEPRRVLGIYVAWNAKRTTLPLAREFTFWGRKKAADRIAQSASITRLVGAIDNIRTQRAQPRDLVVYAGHSFGARLLYSATAQNIVYRMQASHPGAPNGTYSEIDGPGDLIVLLNPAFEASLFSIFNAQRRYQENYSANQPPVIIAISSDNDRATQIAFPIGQVSGLNFSKIRRTTLGNHAEFQTHRLDYYSESADDSHLQTTWLDDFCKGSICLRRTEANHSQLRNPFIVARADSSVLNGHGGIWGRDLSAWLASFISAIDNARTDQSISQPLNEEEGEPSLQWP